MSYIFLQEQGAESSAECYSDIEPFVRSRLNLTAEKSSCSDSEMESCRGSQSGTMCEPSTESHGTASQKLCAVDFRAKTYRRVVHEPVSTENAADSGGNLQGSLARYDRDTHSLKTHQTLLFEDSTEFCAILPEWGTMLDGVCFPLAPLVHHTHEKECFCWPTPRAGRPGSRPNGKGGKVLQEEVQIAAGMRERGQKLDGQKLSPLNPTWCDWLMGWPLDWSDSRPMAMDNFQRWQNSHGRF